MPILSNDPRDLIRERIKKAMDNGGQGSPDPQATGEATGVISNDTMQVDNPFAKEGFNPLAFVLGSTFAFWRYTIGRFWWTIFLMIGGLYFMHNTPEALAELTAAGYTTGVIIKAALTNAFFATVASWFPPLIIGTRLKNGGSIQRSHVMLLQIPGFMFAFMTFWNVAAGIYLKFMGII